MEEPKISRLGHQLLDHVLVYYLLYSVTLAPFDDVAVLWLALCGLVALVGLHGTWRKLELGLYGCFTLVLMAYAYATTSSSDITPGFSKPLCFGVVWAFILGLSLVSRKWGLLRLKSMLCTPRFAVSLAMVRVMVSTLTLGAYLFRPYTNPMLLQNTYSFYSLRDVTVCSAAEQTDLRTGIPIPGLSVWPKLSFSSVHLEGKLLVFFAVANILGAAKTVSMPLMLFFQLRVFGQQFFYNFRPHSVRSGDDLFIEHGHVHLYHYLSLLMWSSIVMVFTPCADTLSVDAIVACACRKAGPNSVDSRTKSRKYGFHINFLVLLLGIGYYLSGCGKAGSGVIFGTNWVNSYGMEGIFRRYLVGYAKLTARGIVKRDPFYLFAEFPSLRAFLTDFPIIMRLGALGTIVWECGFIFMTSHGGLWRTAALLMGVGFHLGIYLCLNINFLPFLISYVVFIPWGGIFEYVRSLRKPIDIFHDDSDSHLRMKRTLASCCVLHNLNFRLGMPEGLEEGHRMEGTRKQQVLLPSVPTKAQPHTLMEMMTNWISSNEAPRTYFCHLLPLFRAICWGLKCSDFLKARSNGFIRVGAIKNKVLTVHLPRFAMGLVVFISLVSVGNFRGSVGTWPFSELPRFGGDGHQANRVYFPEESIISKGSPAGFALSPSGKPEPIEMQWLLRTEPDYEDKKNIFEEQLEAWNVDSLQLPFGCSDNWLRSFPPWYLWLTSVPGHMTPEKRNKATISGWEDSLTSAIGRCWQKDASFLDDAKVRKVCSKVRAADKLVYYGRQMEVSFGPPWEESVWDLGNTVHQLPLSNTTFPFSH